MKQLIIALGLSLLTLFLQAQSGGSGTSGDPYWGDVSTSPVWSVGTYTGNTVYIGTSSNPDLRVISGGHLTIDPGMTVVFKELGSDLIITGTGRISAGGTGSSVTFTKDASKSYWGHISFQSMDVSAGSSLINNCIIEYGDVRSNSGSAKYGGGIYADFSNLTIKNAIIQHNKAEWGGGIFVNEDEYPGIENCYVYDNFSKEGGGGIYLWNRASSTIKSCLFQENHCDGTTFSYYTGGGLGSQGNGSIKLLNSTFVNNTSSRTSGQSIMLYAGTNNILINCIVWGSTGNHFYLTGTNTIQYTAVQGSAPSGTGNFVLSSNNSDATGPNFTNPSGSDWSIKFISPCRDAGTTPNPTVPNDYIGNPRIGPYDIGAYEVAYNRWLTTASDPTSWTNSANWEQGFEPGHSGTTGDVIIPSLTSSYAPDISGSTTITSGKYFILNPGAKATFGSLSNSGTLMLGSDATNISSLIVGSYSGNAATVELYLTGGEAGSKNYRWHYISTPVSTLPVSTFTTVTPDIVRYWDSRVSTDLVQGWVAQDGWIYATGTYDYTRTFTSLSPGLGYDFYDSNNNKFTFSGQLNTSDVPMTLDYYGGANNGFNLLGNPFSSGLDWDYIISQPGYPTNTSKGLYFTRDNTLCSYIAGVGSPSDVNGFIPPMQGFFTKTEATGKTITLAAAAKTHSIHSRYKGSEIIPLIRLSLADDTLSDETVVRFDEKASADLDNEYDALKIFYSDEYTAIYSSLSGTKYVINGQPFPDTEVTIPIVVNLLATGVHTITITQLQGLDTYNVYLIDNVSGFTANLKTSPIVSFTSSAGFIPDRFILKVSYSSTGIEEPDILKGLFNIYHGFGFINIQLLADDWDGLHGSVTVLDLTGRKVTDLRNTEFTKNSLLSVPSTEMKGIYIVEMKSGMKRYVGKVVIK